MCEGSFEVKEASMLEKHVILGIHVRQRTKHIPEVQTILTEYGCSIRTRLGLHDADGKYCSPSGVILLELVGDEKQFDALEEKLSKVEGVEVKRMVFDHP
jgi:hypothetical protein